MQLLHRKVLILFGVATLCFAGFTFAFGKADNVSDFRQIHTELQKIDFDAAPAQTNGFFNLTETEWPFFSLIYWGYSGVNLAQTVPEVKQEALKDVNWALEKLQTRRVSGFIEAHFGPAFGEGFHTPSTLYHGHFLMLALRYREVSNDTRYDELIHKIAKAFVESFDQESSGILLSYRNLCWPSDTLPALAALRLHDRLFQTTYAETPCRNWSDSMQKHYVDTQSGLLCASINPKTQQPTCGPRGVGLMFSFPFLRVVDSELAHRQFALAKKFLVGSAMGFRAVREYPPGQDGAADIDSGEIIMGYGQGASGFAIAAAAAMNDSLLHDELCASQEIFTGLLRGAGAVNESMSVPLVGKCVILFGRTSKVLTSD